MEDPEKLYLIQDNGLICYCRNNDEDIEYTRTDAFIEKAEKWMKENFFFNNNHYSIESGVFDSMEEMCEDFKRYMED